MKISDYESRKYLMLYVGWLKAMGSWYHAAHHASSGLAFSGDHGILFDKIYTEIQDEVDGAIEKAIGLTNDDRFACPILTTKTMLAILENYQSPVYDAQEDIIKNALNIQNDYLDFLEEMFANLENKEVLSLGLNDQLAASANQHELYVYLLQQRIKE